MSEEGRPGVKAFQCPSCGASLTLRGMGQTMTVACTSCGSITDISGDEFKVLRESQNMKYAPLFPLGTRGKFRGDPWEIIGFMVRCDGSGMYFWREYLLFNPYKGFRWLNEFNGHWTIFDTMTQVPEVSYDALTYKGTTYKQFLSGKAKVVFVYGEFYWRVEVGDVVGVTDYIAPPYLISCEKSKDEKVWTLGEYVQTSELKEFLPKKASFPYKTGIAPNQPSPWQGQVGKIWGTAFLFFCILTAAHLVLSAMAKKELLLSETFTYNSALKELPVRTRTFKVPGPTGNLEVSTASSTQNNWLEVGVELVEATTEESSGAPLEMAYYTGSDSDGPWQEGSNQASVMFSAVPPGDYYLMLNTEGSPDISWKDYSVVVRRNVPYWGNYILSLFIILAYPIYISIRNANFEGLRWGDADDDGDSGIADALFDD